MFYGPVSGGAEVYLYDQSLNKGEALGETFDSIESLAGTNFDDVLALDFRSSAAGRLDGNGGHDVLNGSGGANQIYGDAGNDKINGGGNNDELFGGSGADTFFFTGTQSGADTSGNDIIRDFNAAEGDVIHLYSDIFHTWSWQNIAPNVVRLFCLDTSTSAASATVMLQGTVDYNVNLFIHVIV